jgi:hypothetical protein
VIGSKTVLSPPFNVSIGSVSRLRLESAPTGGISSVALATSQVSGVDAGGNVVPTLPGQITVRKFSGDTLLSSLTGTTRVAVSAGSAAFADLALSGADSALVLEFGYSLSFDSQISVRTGRIVVTGPRPGSGS